MKLRVCDEIAKNCVWLKSAKGEWISIAEDRIEALNGLLPSGAGFQNAKIDADKTTQQKIIITFDYCDFERGLRFSYKLIFKSGFFFNDMKIIGKDPGGLKDFFYDTFGEILEAEFDVKIYKE